jgi:hypothetical protein
MTPAEFTAHQERRRSELWTLLGDLPEWRPPRLVSKTSERRDGYTLEKLVLDLNGVENVPAYFLIPDNLKAPGPALLYIHWHGGAYKVGKDEILTGHGDYIRPYAPVCVEKGLAMLAIDSWCFGARRKWDDARSETDTFKLMLWRGQVLWGMMMFDEFQAVSYLVSRPEVDASRIGAFGISMGSTKAWWLAALDPRVRCCIDVCCLTDYEELIKADNLRGHGVYYYVPGLLKKFSTSQINELIVPRARLSVNGRQDLLTPPAGVEKVRDHLMPLYKMFGKEADCRIELFDCGHRETPEMRRLASEWLDTKLINPR